MGLETGTYIDSLNASNPVSGDGLNQSDDHHRLIKATIKASFPNISGAMTSSHTELNLLDGETGIASANTASAIVKRDGSGNFVAGTITADLTGTASAVTATDNTANETTYLTFVDGATGSQGLETNTGLTYNPSTGVLTAGSFSGTTAAANITVADESTDTTCFPVFTTAATGDLPPKTGTNLSFNSSTGALTATSFVGNVTGNVTGDVTGYSNTADVTNVGGGYLALASLGAGIVNTAFGYKSLNSQVDGDFCVAIGYEALKLAESDANTAVGFQAGSDITTALNNLCLGSGAGLAGSPSGSITNTGNKACYGDNSITDHYMAGDLHLTTGQLVSATSTPASAGATGTAGTIAWDADYIYVCTSTDTWKRVAIATWP